MSKSVDFIAYTLYLSLTSYVFYSRFPVSKCILLTLRKITQEIDSVIKNTLYNVNEVCSNTVPFGMPHLVILEYGGGGDPTTDRIIATI